MIKTLMSIAMLLVLSACAGTTSAPTPEGQFNTQRTTPEPTVGAPEYRTANTRLDAQSASQLQYLGRLDNTSSIPSSIFAHDISPDGTRLAAINNDIVIVWDLISGQQVFFEGRFDASKVFFSFDKTELYTIASDGQVTVNNADTGDNLNTFNSGVAFNGRTSFYEAEGWLALGSDDGNIQIWDTLNRTSLVTFQAHNSPIVALIFNTDGTQLATIAQDDAIIKVWDWRNRNALQTLNAPSTGLNQVAFAPDNSAIAIATDQYTQYIPLDGRPVLSYQIGVPLGIDILQFSPDGRYLLSGGTEETLVSILNVEESNVFVSLPNTTGIRTGAAFSNNGSLLITTSLDSGAILWNINSISGDTINNAQLDIPSIQITDVAWSEDDFVLTLFDATGSVYVLGVP
jgi:WD40 repeat protein